MSGWVLFTLGGRAMASALDDVREVVRATGIEGLAGVRAPVTGVLEVRGDPVPVVDLRSGHGDSEAGDVLVLSTPDGVVGVAVDEVRSVLAVDELVAPGAEESLPGGLPSYVVEIRRSPDARPVLVVSLPALAGLAG